MKKIKLLNKIQKYIKSHPTLVLVVSALVILSGGVLAYANPTPISGSTTANLPAGCGPYTVGTNTVPDIYSTGTFAFQSLEEFKSLYSQNKCGIKNILGSLNIAQSDLDSAVWTTANFCEGKWAEATMLTTAEFRTMDNADNNPYRRNWANYGGYNLYGVPSNVAFPGRSCGDRTAATGVMITVNGTQVFISSECMNPVFTEVPTPLPKTIRCNGLALGALTTDRKSTAFVSGATTNGAVISGSTLTITPSTGVTVTGTHPNYTISFPANSSTSDVVYTVVADVTGNDTKEQASAECSKTITIPGTPAKKIKCSGISVSNLTADMKVTVTVNGRTSNGGAISSTSVTVTPSNGVVISGTGPTFTVTLPANANTSPVTYTIVGSVIGDGIVETSDSSCSQTVTVPGKVNHPNVEITKNVSKNGVLVGEEFNYVLTVKNTGDIDLINTTVSDKAPTNVEFIKVVENSNGVVANITKDNLGLTITKLEVGKLISIKFSAKVTTFVDADITNTACVDAKEVVVSGKPENQDSCATANVKPAKPCKYNSQLAEGDVNCKQVITITTPVKVPDTGVKSIPVFSGIAATMIGVYALALNKNKKKHASHKK